MANKSKPNSDTGIILVKSFFVLLVVNVVVIATANKLFPNFVVLGTNNLNLGWSLFHSMGTLALINTLAIPLIHEYENFKGRMLSSKEWMIKYFVINFVGLWAITRFAEQFGLGVTSWMVVASLAIVLDFFQGIAMMTLEKYRNK